MVEEVRYLAMSPRLLRRSGGFVPENNEAYHHSNIAALVSTPKIQPGVIVAFFLREQRHMERKCLFTDQSKRLPFRPRKGSVKQVSLLCRTWQ